MDIKVGDVVKLKSGSPKMTVEDIGSYMGYTTEKQAKCIWFEGAKKQEDVFELHSLKAEES